MKPTLVSAVLVAFFAGIFGYNKLYLHHQQAVRGLRSQLTEQQQTQALREQLAGSLEQVERFRKRLPPEADTEWLVRQVGKLAEETGVHLVSIVPQNPRQVQEFTHLAVSLQFSSPYHQVGKFLSTLESSPSFMRVEDLDISHGRDGSSQVRLTVGTFYVPPMSDTKAAPSRAGRPKPAPQRRATKMEF